jgi:putative ABC transport system permease protein
MKDLTYAVRTLVKNPGFSLVAVLTLALGIGANSAVFSAFDQIILELLPVKNPRELVLLEIDGPQVTGQASADNHHTVHSHPQLLDYRERTGEIFGGVAGRTFAPAAFSFEGDGERIYGDMVSGNFFELLGVKPAVGRLFTEEDDRVEGGHPLVVLSHAFWTSKLGGREDIVGQKVSLNGSPMTVIGVVEADFYGLMSGGSGPETYVTLAMRKQMLPRFYQSESPERTKRHINLIARLQPGVNQTQAQAAMQSIFQGILTDELAELGTRVRDKEEYRNRTLTVTPALQGIHNLRESIEEPLLSVMALVALVLLIACVNVAGLLMARALARSREIAVRIALGAGSGSIVRQVLVESLVLALAGGLAGLLVAHWSMYLLNDWMGDGGRVAIELNGRVMAFNFALALLTGLLFGLLPAFQATRVDLASTIKDQSAGAGAARHHAAFRRGMVVAQVALSMLLLVAAGLFARTLYNLQNYDPGFRTRNLLAFSIDPALSGYGLERGNLFYADLQRRLGTIAGASSVASAELPLLGGAVKGSGVSVEGYEVSEGEEMGTSQNTVSPGYFKTLGIPLLLGRDFNAADTAASQKVAVVNEAFVERYFAGENPLGRRMSFRGGKSGDDLDMEIVGVVKNQKNSRLREDMPKLTYTPYTQSSYLVSMTYYLLSERPESSLGPEVRNVLRDADANLPIFKMQTVAAAHEDALELERTVALLATAFAGIATVLAAIGLYGLMAYGVARRTREIGVRVALGAQRGDVLGMVFREALVYLGFGLAIGIPLALGLTTYLDSQLFGLSARDPFVLVGAAVVLALAVMVAAVIPARRAARVNPTVALRYE